MVGRVAAVAASCKRTTIERNMIFKIIDERVGMGSLDVSVIQIPGYVSLPRARECEREAGLSREKCRRLF